MTGVKGSCPMGCGEGLILGEGGVLWCGSLLCPEPDAAARILADDETGHIVLVSEDGWTARHPLRERLDDALMACQIAQHVAGRLESFPTPPGRYRVAGDPAGALSWERLG